MSSRNTPQRSTCCRSDPPALRIACRFFRHCSVWVSTSAPASWPVAGSVAPCPDTKIEALETHAGRVRADGLRKICGVNGLVHWIPTSFFSLVGYLSRVVTGSWRISYGECRDSSSRSNTRERRYSGWQKQKNARTVQGEIERAIGAADARQDIRVHGLGTHRRRRPCVAAGRASRSAKDRCPRKRSVAASTTSCPPTSTCLRSIRVPHRFHARHGAVARSYLYQVSRRRSAFAKPFVWWVKEPLDLERMTAAAARFTGMHDFQAFSDDDPEEKSTDVLVEDVTRRRGRRPDPGPRRRLALHLEDGAPHGRRARRGRQGTTRPRRRRQPAVRQACPSRVAYAGVAYRAGIRPVSRAGVLRR